MARPGSRTSDSGARLLAAAGRGFRVGGYGGAGVDALAREAGLTSGAFYAHFGSKAQAFRLALADGLEGLRAGVAAAQAQHGEGWLAPFVEFYLGARLDDPLALSCALPTLTTDAARAEPDARDAYTQGLAAVVEQMATGFSSDDRRGRAWRLLALLAGGAAMARAVSDPGLREEIRAATRSAALGV